MPANLRLIMHAAQRHSGELAAAAPARWNDRARSCRRRADRQSKRIAPRRSSFGVLHPTLQGQLADGEELEDAVLDLLQVVVVFVEHLPGAPDVEVVRGKLVPGQVAEPVEIRLDHRELGGLRSASFPSGSTRAAPLLGLLAHSGIFNLGAVLFDFDLRLIRLARVPANRFELLAQDELALRLFDPCRA